MISSAEWMDLTGKTAHAFGGPMRDTSDKQWRSLWSVNFATTWVQKREPLAYWVSSLTASLLKGHWGDPMKQGKAALRLASDLSVLLGASTCASTVVG